MKTLIMMSELMEKIQIDVRSITVQLSNILKYRIVSIKEE